jgi:hypothetical protein
MRPSRKWQNRPKPDSLFSMSYKLFSIHNLRYL